MYLRDRPDIAVIRPGYNGADIVGERWQAGGTGEMDLLPQGDERTMYRIVMRQALPDTVLLGLAGRPLREIVEIPPHKGFCPRRGNDLGSDMLHSIGDNTISHARRVERGTLVAVLDDRTKEIPK